MRAPVVAWRSTLGALQAARPARVRELTRLDEAVRRPLALSTRVGVVGVAGGTGCSTAAGLLAALLAHRRGTRVLAVNASRRRRSLLWHAGLTDDARSTAAQEASRAAAHEVRAATQGLVRSPGGAHGLDLGDQDDVRPARTVPPGDERWWSAVAPISRFFDFVVTDWGVRDTLAMGHVVASSTLVCVVATPDRESLQRAVDLAAAVEATGTATVLAVVPARGRPGPGIRAALRALPFRTQTLPVDLAHGADAPAAPSALRLATRLAALRLAALVVDEAAARRPGARAGTPPTAVATSPAVTTAGGRR